MSKPILCLDFDGVCHSYTSGWRGTTEIPDPPVDGLWEFLNAALDAFDVQIFSTRSHQPGGRRAMEEWFFRHTPNEYTHLPAMLSYPLEKPPAMVTLDDRAITFTGTWPSIESLANFKPWNK